MAMTLSEKLMLDKFQKKLILNKPTDVTELDGQKFDTEYAGPYDMIINFVFSLDDLKAAIQKAHNERQLSNRGIVYIVYPKKGNKRYRDYIDRESLFPIIGMEEAGGFVEGTSLKFARLCSFNEIFTVVGLKYELERGKDVKVVTHGDNNYRDRIPDLKEALKKAPELQTFYEKLPFGYQKDWARFIFSSKSPEIKARRMQEMEMILRAGFKSKELYRTSLQQRKP